MEINCVGDYKGNFFISNDSVSDNNQFSYLYMNENNPCIAIYELNIPKYINDFNEEIKNCIIFELISPEVIVQNTVDYLYNSLQYFLLYKTLLDR